MKRHFIIVIAIIVATILIVMWQLNMPADTHTMSSQNQSHDMHDKGMTRGPRRGRLLTHEGFSLEITIFEAGTPPNFRLYAYDNNQPVDPDTITVAIQLKRTGNKTDNVQFTPQEDYLNGDTIIVEPHSFDVEVNAEFEGKSYHWQYENYEGRTKIPASMAKAQGIQTQLAGPVTLIETRSLTGRVQTNPNRLSRVRPRFPGIVKALRHELGDEVRAGDSLATVQSNESLQNYQVKAPINGVIIKRDIQIGEATGDEPLFIIADHSDVWVELDVFVRDLSLIKQGQSVLLETLDGKYQKQALISWISPLTAHASQSVRARVVVSNEDGHLRPGQFIRGNVTVAEHAVPLAVRQSAIQGFRDFQVVFARFEDIFEVRMLELGRSNADWVEVLSGIDPGTTYVTENSYLIKADIEKSGASHDH